MITPPDRIDIDTRDAHLTRHFISDDGVTFTIMARINSYRDQSSILLARWNGTEWQRVTSLHGSAITTWPVANGARIAKTFTADHIKTDIETLMTEAEFITQGFK